MEEEDNNNNDVFISWELVNHIPDYLSTEDDHREWLETHFRPVFDSYKSEGGIPANQLKSYLKYKNYSPPRHKKENLDRLIADKELTIGRVTYEEFYECVIRIRKRDLKRRLSLALESLSSVFPSLMVDEYKEERRPISRMSSDVLEDEIGESYLEACDCKPPPLIIPTLVILQIIIFGYYAAQLHSKSITNRKYLLTWNTGLPDWSPLIFMPNCRQEVWRFFTYMLIHQGYIHIICNTFTQLLCGLPLETVHKFWRIGPLYMTGVLGGSLASSVLDPDNPLIGASGGCYALFGAHFALVIINWDELQYDCWHYYKTNIFCRIVAIISSGVSRSIFLIVSMLTDVGVRLYQSFAMYNVPQTSYACHGGGFIAGFMMGIVLLRNFQVRLWEKVLLWVCLSCYISLMMFGIIWNIVHRDRIILHVHNRTALN